MFDLVTIFIIVLTLFIFYQYMYKRRHGIWSDEIPFETDESLMWSVKYLSFGIFSSRGVTLPPGSKMISKINGSCMLDIYDQKMRHINHFYNPQFLIFEEGSDLFQGVEYHFLLTYYSEEEIEATAFIDLPNKKEYTQGSIYEIFPKEYYNEENYKKEYSELMKRIIEEMGDNNYELEKIENSELRRSFPHNMLMNEITIDLSNGRVVVIMVTNKKKIFSLDEQTLEFESDEKSFVWNPTSDENFAFLILDEDSATENEGVEIVIREYLYCEESRLLPIRALTFN